MAEEQQAPPPLAASVGVITEVRQHPENGRWCVMAMVTGPSGNALYVSNDTWIFEESARRYQLDKIDPEIDAALKLFRQRGHLDPFDTLDNVLSKMDREPTYWEPGQFEGMPK